MPRISIPDGLGALLDKQLSVTGRGQLLALGLTDRAVQYRVRPGGPWQTLLPGVYLAASGVPSLPQKEMAALLYAGPGSLITGPMALMNYSIRTGPVMDDVIDVLVPTERQRLTAGFARLHRTARMPSRSVQAAATMSFHAARVGPLWANCRVGARHEGQRRGVRGRGAWRPRGWRTRDLAGAGFADTGPGGRGVSLRLGLGSSLLRPGGGPRSA